MNKDQLARNKALAKLKRHHKEPINPEALFSELEKGNTSALSRSITLTESTLPEHKKAAKTLLNLCLKKAGKAKRIGITGVPGVGKSSFLEAFGSYLIEAYQLKIAVLAVDPSSKSSGGSILGDKTRMETLSMHKNAYIRPSPSASSLGGVAQKTREALLLCEAAGYDIVFIETVGVGQSETTVKNMVDYFLLLMLSGAGDELQGIKRGIMEMADALVVTKADGENKAQAGRAASAYKTAMHLLPPHPGNWVPPVGICSAHNQMGFDKIWNQINQFYSDLSTSGFLRQQRNQQNLDWFQQSTSFILQDDLMAQEALIAIRKKLEMEVLDGAKLPHLAAEELMQAYKKNIAANP